MRIHHTVQVFAKYPHIGNVKTRLAAEAGAELAAQIYCELVERQLEELMQLPQYVRLELWCTENATMPYNKLLLDRWSRLRFCRQAAGDLGQKLEAALARSARFSCRVLQIGTDCPVLQAAHVMEAAASLEYATDAVFIPAEDGGYVLGGYGSFRPGMFDNIEWSTSQVMCQVSAQLNKLNFSVAELPVLWDIDHLSDLQRYRRLRACSPE